MKGKYGTRAAIRKEASEVEATEAAYRRQIVRLTEERNEARAERDEARKLWKQEVRVLRAQLSEGTSARVQAQAFELERVRAERAKLATEVERLRRFIRKQELPYADPTVDRIVNPEGNIDRAVKGMAKAGRSFIATRLNQERRRVGLDPRLRHDLSSVDDTLDRYIDAVLNEDEPEGE